LWPPWAGWLLGARAPRMVRKRTKVLTARVARRYIWGMTTDNRTTGYLDHAGFMATLYSGRLLMHDFGDFQLMCEEALGRPIWTHEFASSTLIEQIKERVADQLLERLR
jgi:hypothetical protein